MTHFDHGDLPLVGSCVSPITLLTTDYLNHFNEPVMMLQMAADVPDVLEDLRAWQPRGYVDHFRASGIADRDIAIAAYARSPAEFRTPFDDTIAELAHEIRAAVAKAVESPGRARELDAAIGRCQSLIARAASIANGTGLQQTDIDSLFD
jgi:hypothetical protein